MNELRDSQLQLLWTARIDYSTSSRVEPHQHNDYEQLLVILSGDGEVCIGEQKYTVKEGAAYLLLRGVSHSFQFKKDTITLDFKFRLSDSRILKALGSAEPYCICRGTELSEIKQWYKMSLQQMRNPVSVHPLRIEAGFKSTLVSLLLGGTAVHASPYAALPSVDDNEPLVHYLKTNFAEKITLDLLAKHFGFNRNYLIKIFYDKTGITPIQFLQAIRLEKSKEYLEFTSLSISEVADKVGWTLPYFSKILKKQVGLSPSQYRDSLLNAVGKDIILEHDFLNEWRIVR
ncbi:MULTISPECIES: AraC family transcriptional regulator [unclassified Paenibacillus]|uniref:AraC family transcriptional regulator n=1 Tax=unclassified Paenibacillus TaxID=185978 RepID=UPI00363363FD